AAAGSHLGLADEPVGGVVLVAEGALAEGVADGLQTPDGVVGDGKRAVWALNPRQPALGVIAVAADLAIAVGAGCDAAEGVVAVGLGSAQGIGAAREAVAGVVGVTLDGLVERIGNAGEALGVVV